VKKTLLFLWIRIFIVLALSSVSLAMAETISRIEVSGNLHVDSQTIRNSAGLNVGMEITNLDIDKATKRIFSMGIFSDVAIHLDGPILVIHVVEDKMIRKISFQGNKKIKDIDLERMIVLKVHRSFEPSILESDKQVIHDAYLHLGFHEVSVSSSTVNLGQGYVNVLFKINEGKRSGISSIIFKGNRAFSVSRLRDVIRSKRSNLLNWLTGGDIYSEERLAEDRETLHRFYNDHGYADFHLIASDAGLNPENDTYKITFSFDEGSLYHISDINIDTSMIGIHSDFLRKILKIHEGDVYNAKKIEDSLLALENRISDLGYSFARFEVLTSRDFVNHKISILYRVKQSSQTYVERIEIHGNNKTRDEVIRREFDMSEGDSFSPIRIKRAQHRLESLGFFQRVNISTAPGSDVDQIILVVDVLEQPTGDFSVGGGYTTGGESPGLSLEASITDHNFLGRGQYLRFGLGGGQQASRNYSFSFTEPYFLGYRLSSGFDVFHQTYRMNDDYDVRQTGGMIRFRIPITDEVEGSLAYNYLEEKYDLGQISDNDDLRELYDRYSGAVIEAALIIWRILILVFLLM
jgi:outer membrane protein insertion porin family